TVVVPTQAVVQRQAPRQLVVVLEVEAVVVLERLAVGVPARLPASGHAPGHEVVEAFEIQHAPVTGVEVLVDVRAAELVAELHAVASRGVGDVGEALPVRVYTAAWQVVVAA